MLWVLIVALLLVACIVSYILYLKENDKLDEKIKKAERFSETEEKLKEMCEKIKRGEM